MIYIIFFRILKINNYIFPFIINLRVLLNQLSNKILKYIYLLRILNIPNCISFQTIKFYNIIVSLILNLIEYK